MRTFNEIKSDFKSKCFGDDQVTNHIEADELLCEVALNVNLSEEERNSLVDLYNGVGKWFA